MRRNLDLFLIFGLGTIMVLFMITAFADKPDQDKMKESFVKGCIIGVMLYAGKSDIDPGWVGACEHMQKVKFKPNTPKNPLT